MPARPLTCSTPILLRPAVPLPDHRRPGPQLRRARRPAALRLPAPARRPALDRQPAQPSTGSGRRRSSTDLRAEVETLYRDGIDRPKLATGSRRTSWSPPTSPRTRARAGPRAPDALDLDAAAAQARRRRAAGRVSAQHVLRGARQEARRRDRLHQGDHAHEHGGSPREHRLGRRRGSVVVAGGGRRRGAAAGGRGSPRPAPTVVAADASAERLEPVVAQGNAAAAAAATCTRRHRRPARRAGHPGLGRRVRAEFGRVDGLVHLVGGWRGGESFTETDLADWDAAAGPADPHAPAHLARLPRRLSASDDGAAACWSATARRERADRGQRRLRRGQGRRRGLDPGAGRLVPQGGEQRRRGCILVVKALVTTAMRAAKPGREVRRLHRRRGPGRGHRRTCGPSPPPS